VGKAARKTNRTAIFARPQSIQTGPYIKGPLVSVIINYCE
jgi:hypothetical protein